MRQIYDGLLLSQSSQSSSIGAIARLVFLSRSSSLHQRRRIHALLLPQHRRQRVSATRIQVRASVPYAAAPYAAAPFVATGRTSDRTQAAVGATMVPGSQSSSTGAASTEAASKRKNTDSDAPDSPPPPKKKLQSGTTKSAMTNFFAPRSQQKPVGRTTWSERAVDKDSPETLLVAQYAPHGHTAAPTPQTRRKLAAFDLDSTLIVTSSGKVHASDEVDWKWWDPCVPGKLQELHGRGFQIAIFSNQAGFSIRPEAGPKSKSSKSTVGRLSAFKLKCASILSLLDLPISLYAATGRDVFRKPCPGMWTRFLDDHDIDAGAVDLGESVFVGDAGGRTATVVDGTAQSGSGKGGRGKKAAAAPARGTKKDFSCSDRNFAHNVGLSFLTPEEFFLGEGAREFAREFDLAKYPHVAAQERQQEQQRPDVVTFAKKNDREIVVFCGPPGAGKSTFYWRHLKPLGYERVSQDVLKTREKCVSHAEGLIRAGQAAVVDNTNADPGTRAVWTGLAKRLEVPVRCVWFKTPLSVAKHNDAVRSMNVSLNPESRSGLPAIAFTSFSSRFREPKAAEGFDEVIEVEFGFVGTKEEYDVWGKYWT